MGRADRGSSIAPTGLWCTGLGPRLLRFGLGLQLRLHPRLQLCGGKVNFSVYGGVLLDVFRVRDGVDLLCVCRVECGASMEKKHSVVICGR